MNLPDPLKLKANGLNAIQAAVYEDFGMFSCDFAHCSLLTRTRAGNDGKRRYASATGSRPGSAIPRPDQLAAAFGGSPAPGHMSVLLDHAEIVERFSVRCSLSLFRRNVLISLARPSFVTSKL